MPTFDISVWFEFESQPAVNHRVTLTATSAAVATRRAIVAARKAHPNRNPGSILILVERPAGLIPRAAESILAETPASTGQ